MPRSLLAKASALAIGGFALSASAQKPLTYEIINQDSLASAMMLGLVNENFVYILDKVEGNRATIGATNKPVWGSILNLADNSVTAIDVQTNTFCASGLSLGNGSHIVAGGNSPITYGGVNVTSDWANAAYQDYDGRRAIRIMNPVANSSSGSDIAWIDTPGGVQMQSQRWYPGVESLADGSMVLVGGAMNGGFINRNYPNTDPAYAGGGGGSLTNLNGGANPSYEFYPSKGALQLSNFMVNTSGLNMYAHMFLLPSGNIFMQANYSTAIWNYTANTEYLLPDMPDEVVRVYPASGAVAMLPLTPANSYTPTILFCGGASQPADMWGDYQAPLFNPLTAIASTDCSSITPENADGTVNTAAKYDQEEQLPEGRTMGQFIHLPTGQMLILNGAEKGVAGYGNVSAQSIAYATQSDNYYTWANVFYYSDGTNVTTEGMSQDPTYTPVLYDPELPLGSRLTRDGFGSSTIARLYHSSALLLPDGSVLVGGSNPHMDVTLNMPPSVNGIQAFNTTYELEKWYPDYYFKERPQPQGLPSYLLYGGDTWSFTVDSAYMGDEANYKANNTKIMVIRPGFSTHAMNMGQRSLQLEHSYTVADDGTVTYTVMPMPTNVNLFAPGPALLFVTVDGVPSKGVYLIVGQQNFGGTIPYDYQSNAGSAPTLPSSVNNPKFNAVPSSSSGSSFPLGAIIGVAVGGAAVILLILLGLLCWRRRANKKAGKKGGAAAAAGAGAGAGAIYGQSSYRDGSGGEYKRVGTPASSVHAFPGAASGPGSQMGAFDSYRMNDVSGPNTPYYDSPRDSARMPLTAGAGGQWGESHGGDAGDYYRDNMNRSESMPSQLYDGPPRQDYGGGMRNSTTGGYASRGGGYS